MAKSWYVLHTYSGYENKIERTIRMMMDDGELTNAVTDIKVPSEQVVEVKDGKKREKLRYLQLHMKSSQREKPNPIPAALQ